MTQTVAAELPFADTEAPWAVSNRVTPAREHVSFMNAFVSRSPLNGIRLSQPRAVRGMKPRHSAAAIFLDGKDYGWVDVYEYTHDNGDVYYAIAWSGNSVVFGEFFLDLDNDLTNNQWDALTDGESVPVTLELA